MERGNAAALLLHGSNALQALSRQRQHQMLPRQTRLSQPSTRSPERSRKPGIVRSPLAATFAISGVLHCSSTRRSDNSQHRRPQLQFWRHQVVIRRKHANEKVPADAENQSQRFVFSSLLPTAVVGPVSDEVAGLCGSVQACLPHRRRQNWRARVIVVLPPIYSCFFRGETVYAMGTQSQTCAQTPFQLAFQGGLV
jgi:hypothetical protein